VTKTKKRANCQQGIAKSVADVALLNFLLNLNIGISIEVRCKKSPPSAIPKPLAVML